MKTAKTRNIGSIVGTIILGIFLVTMLCSIDVTPAFSKDYRHDKGRYQKKGHAYGHRKPAPRPYGYYGHRERAYYPPPRVVYAPPPPPGIGIFLPPIFIPVR